MTPNNHTPLSVADIPAIIALEQQAQPNPWSEAVFRDCFANAHYHIVGATSQPSSLAGFMVLHQVFDQAQLMNIVVAPQAQRQGIGRSLLQHGIEHVTQACASILSLEVRSTNMAAIRLYQQLGFTEVGRRKGYYNNAGAVADDAILMDRVIALSSN